MLRMRRKPKKMLTFRDFIKRFGNDMTSNFQLAKWAKDLRIPNFHVVMRDEVKDLPNVNPLNVIVNLEKSDQRGSDWTGLHISNNNAFYFSSYSLPPLREVKDFVARRRGITNRKSSTLKLQDYGDSYCGQAALYFLYRMSHLKNPSSEDFEEIVLDMHREVTSRSLKNDRIQESSKK